MTAYYNEIDPLAAAWIRELIKQGSITEGEVDERSIAEVQPNDIRGFDQCHFFAGIGVWSYALRQARWPDDRPIWTGSCPCQPFSCAGKGKGITDERHLWPEFFRLIKECRPVTAIGEQVAGKNGEDWLNIVQNDMEREAYRVGACVTAACGFGAPHKRKRLYWVADTKNAVRWGREYIAQNPAIRAQRYNKLDGCSPAINMADTDHKREQSARQYTERTRDAGGASKVINLADTISQGQQRGLSRRQDKEWGIINGYSGYNSTIDSPMPTNGHWRDADWIFCRDGKYRPVESFSQPLVDGLADRLGYCSIGGRYSLNPLTEKAENKAMRLKGYGNAIVAQQAQAFIEAYIEVMES